MTYDGDDYDYIHDKDCDDNDGDDDSDDEADDDDQSSLLPELPAAAFWTRFANLAFEFFLTVSLPLLLLPSFRCC